jgi:hypothetical protein
MGWREPMTHACVYVCVCEFTLFGVRGCRRCFGFGMALLVRFSGSSEPLTGADASACIPRPGSEPKKPSYIRRRAFRAIPTGQQNPLTHVHLIASRLEKRDALLVALFLSSFHHSTFPLAHGLSPFLPIPIPTISCLQHHSLCSSVHIILRPHPCCASSCLFLVRLGLRLICLTGERSHLWAGNHEEHQPHQGRSHLQTNLRLCNNPSLIPIPP